MAGGRVIYYPSDSFHREGKNTAQRSYLIYLRQTTLARLIDLFPIIMKVLDHFLPAAYNNLIEQLKVMVKGSSFRVPSCFD